MPSRCPVKIAGPRQTLPKPSKPAPADRELVRIDPGKVEKDGFDRAPTRPGGPRGPSFPEKPLPMGHRSAGSSGSGRSHGDFVMMGHTKPIDLSGRGADKPGGAGKLPSGSLAALLQRLFQAMPKPAAPPAQGGLTAGGVLPGKWHPIKPGGGHADNVFKGPFPAGPSAGTPSIKPRPVTVGSLATLIPRLFTWNRGPAAGIEGTRGPRTPTPHVDRPVAPGQPHVNNLLMRVRNPGDAR